MSQAATTTPTVSPSSLAEDDPFGTAPQEGHHGMIDALLAMIKRNQVLSVAAASAFLLFVAGLGPQIGTSDSLNVMSVNVGSVTTHSIVPGWVYLIISLVAGGALVQYTRTAIPEWLMVTRLAAGISAFAVLLELLQNAVSSSIGVGGAGWGYYLACLSTFVLTFVARVLFSRAKRTAH